MASASPSEEPDAFPTEAFADISEEGFPEGVAARFQAVLDDMAAGGGIAATVMTPDGTWSGASATADGVHDMQPDSQFGIASGTKPIIAAQVMQLVEAGELSLDALATEYLPADFTFDTNGATIRQLLSHRSGIPDWYDEGGALRGGTGVVSGSSTRSSRSFRRLAVPSALSSTPTPTTTCSGSSSSRFASDR